MSAQQIELSVLIATHNRRDLLRRCLDSLSRQTQDPATFEVIVADDGSGDGTADMAEAYEAPFRLRVLRRPKEGRASAHNAAIVAAVGPRCLFLDDDMIASPELIEEHVEAHRRDPRSVGVGAITQQPPRARDWYAHTHAKSWNAHFEEFANREPHWTDCYGANLSLPREVLVDLGGVATDVLTGEDLDLACRLYGSGCRPTYLPKAHGVHDDQKRSWRMLEDARLQGAAHLELSHRYPERASYLLDWFDRAGPKEIALRRLLISLRVPPKLLAHMGRAVPGSERELLWFSFVRRFAFWRGVKEHASRAEWARLTGGGAVETAQAIVPSLTLFLSDLTELPL